MINILFVDDEPNILDGLQRTLRGMRHEWAMSFAGSGPEALTLLETNHIDVIISDMKMPGMDGAELLEKVSERNPHIIRVILSGYSEKELNMKSVGTAHQYLSKPCDPELLKTTLSRVCEMRDLLTDQSLQRLVSQLPSIPSLPGLYTELVNELGRDEPSTREVAEIIRKDLGMTVKILQIVNSAFFGLRRHISDSRSAVDFLGLDTISSLTLGLGLISQFEQDASAAFFATLWAHSLSVGVAANKIAVIENSHLGNDSFTAGLVHDIGRVILAANLPHEFKSACELAKSERISMVEAEERSFGATHASVGAYLLGLWGLPSDVVHAVAYHHSPLDSDTTCFSPLTALHSANGILQNSNHRNIESDEPAVDREYLTKLGLLDRMPVWQEACHTRNTYAAQVPN